MRSTRRYIGRKQRSVARQLNLLGIFVERSPRVEVIISGYTRSGTTYLGELLSTILRLRDVHEPFNPLAVSGEPGLFREREDGITVRSSEAHQRVIKSLFDPGYRGSRLTNNHGHALIYDGRLIKVVRACFYLDQIRAVAPETLFIGILRNPCAAVFSRLRKGWKVPDLSPCIEQIWHELSADQRLLLRQRSKPHVAMATTWCLDNRMLLQNLDDPGFQFVFYESLVTDPRQELVRLLSGLGRDALQMDSKIDRAIDLLRMDPVAGSSLATGWMHGVDRTKIEEVYDVVEVFGLDWLFSRTTHMPVWQFEG